MLDGVLRGKYQLVFFTPEMLLKDKKWRCIFINTLYARSQKHAHNYIPLELVLYGAVTRPSALCVWVWLRQTRFCLHWWALVNFDHLSTFLTTSQLSWPVIQCKICSTWAWPECKFLLGKHSILFFDHLSISWAELCCMQLQTATKQL